MLKIEKQLKYHLALMRKMTVTIILYSQKLGFGVSLSGEESILSKVLLRTIFCPLCNINACLIDD